MVHTTVIISEAYLERIALGEAHVADIAVVGFFTSVYAQVTFEFKSIRTGV